jgi:hypothetical protein
MGCALRLEKVRQDKSLANRASGKFTTMSPRAAKSVPTSSRDNPQRAFAAWPVRGGEKAADQLHKA